MKLVKVHAENYGSFAGAHDFVLSDRGLVIVLGDNQDEPRMNSNGSGKSTLFDAVDWCLFGKVPRGDHADSIIHDRAGKALCDVSVDLEDDDGTPVAVRRWRGKQKGLTLTVGGKDLSALDSDETQALIEKTLGVDRAVFHAAVLFGQTDLFRFADSTSDAERMEVLTKILQLGDIDVWLEAAKAKKAAFDARWSQHSTEMDAKMARSTVMGAELPTFRQQSHDWEEERAESLRRAVVQLDEFRSNITEHEKVVAHKATVEASYQQLLTECRDVKIDLSGFDARIRDAREAETKARGEMAACTAEGQRLNAQITAMQSLGEGACTRCGQPISPAHVDREVAEMSTRRDALRVAFKTHEGGAALFSAQVAAAENEREAARTVHYEADKVNNRLVVEARAQVQHIQQSEEYLQKATAHADHLRQVMADTQAKANPWLAREAEYQDKIRDLHDEIKAMAAERSGVEAEAALIDFWIQGFGPRGLKSYVIDSKLQEMTDAANKWVRVLTGGTVWVRFETQKEGRTTKTLRNNLNVRVFRYNPDGSVSERNYKSWSGGEKQRVSLGIDFGLSRLIASRSRKQYDVLILDELFKHLDQAGREAVVEMLHELRREKSSVFCVDHDSEFQGAFESRVLIRKSGGNSQIVEDTHAEKPSGASSVNRVPDRYPIPKITQQSPAH